jgi:hypothetical protein
LAGFRRGGNCGRNMSELPTKIGWFLWIGKGDGLYQGYKYIWYDYPFEPQIGDILELNNFKVKLNYKNEEDLEIKGIII